MGTERGGGTSAGRGADEPPPSHYADDAATSAETWERARDHAWRYFELHAGQRMTAFNFFVVLAGFVAAGIGATMQGPSRLSLIGCPLALLLVVLSFVFWKLDQRIAFFVKHAERAHEVIEAELLPPAARLFSGESTARVRSGGRGPLGGLWTYGRAFRLAFGGMAAVGLTGAALSTARLVGALDWEPAASRLRAAPPVAEPGPPHAHREGAPAVAAPRSPAGRVQPGSADGPAQAGPGPIARGEPQ